MITNVARFSSEGKGCTVSGVASSYDIDDLGSTLPTSTSISLNEEEIQKLINIVKEVNEEADDEQSEVGSTSLVNSISFLSKFNFETIHILPDILVEPDGSIAFEWESSDGASSFIISFANDEYFYYAGLSGESRELCGKEIFDTSNALEIVYFYLNRNYFA